RLLGAEEATIVYRRARARMSASLREQNHARENGVAIRCNARPLRIVGEGAAQAVEFAYTEDGAGGLRDAGETFTLAADQVFKAIGQTFAPGAPGAALDLALDGGKIAVDAEGRTSVAGVWAGGDCAAGGEDLTVTAVAQGRDAGDSIHRALGA
ncbi:MAG: dihydropyrimidine dehydrogenase, partial [Rhodobacterales bacterium CG18_big_fil_WC_8_21_14_2_50_71_9]